MSKMTWVLMLVTLASLAAAGTLAAVVWRMRREAQERADARVAALEADIEGGRPAAIALDWAVGQPADGVGADVVDAGEIFRTSREDAGHGRYLGPAVAAAALVLASLVGGLLLVGPGTRSSASTRAQPDAPLELLSLRHERKGEQLTVTGFARNPVHGAPVERLTAVVFFFDSAGEFLASGRAPLDFTRLEPGDESPFTVSAAVPESVRRYRVSFRRETGGAAPHVDRRGRE
jgi:hypothetical protein